MAAKLIIVLFDGTWNEPEFEVEGQYPQGDSTNVEKLRYLLLQDHEQKVLYSEGVGTDGIKPIAVGEQPTKFGLKSTKLLEKPIKVKDGAFGISAQQKVDDAYKAISADYSPGDQLAIFGFSRGAATARLLTRQIHKSGINGKQVMVEFLGLWDTVAALGVPLPDIQSFRKQYSDAEDRLRIPTNVKSVVHLVSIDETRALFAPTLVTRDSNQTKVDEIWFAGNHGDVGGGWVKASPSEAQLSDITLDFMIRRSQSEVSSIKFASNWQSHLNVPKDGGGMVHDVGRFTATNVLGGKYVRELSSTGHQKARIHRSVSDKFASDATYRPAALGSGLASFEIVD